MLVQIFVNDYPLGLYIIKRLKKKKNQEENKSEN